MALSDYKIEQFAKPVSALADKPQMSAAELKAWFDSNSENELKSSVNGMIDELEVVLASKADTDDMHTHENKAVLDEIAEVPVTHEELEGEINATLDEAITYDNRLAESFDEKIKDFVTNDEAQLMCDLTLASANNHANSGDAELGKEISSLEKQISAGAVDRISLAEADTFYSGMAIVSENIDDIAEPSGHPVTGVRYENTHILICSRNYDLFDQFGDGYYVRDSLDRYTQTLYKSGGEVLVRTCDMGSSGWSEWQSVSASKEYVDGKIGEIDGALDGILAIQAELIGGESA